MRKPPLQTGDASRIREEALDWFVRRQGEGFGANDEQMFQNWLAADKANSDAFSHWQGEWQSFDEIPQSMRSMLQRNLAYEQAMDAASASGAARAGARGPSPSQQEAPTTPSRRQVLKSAFALAAIAAVTGGTSLLAWNHWQAQPVFTHAFSTQRGQQVEVPLPDGSRLRLDTSTRLEVTYYRQRREVRLIDGQAVFAVQSDADRPFHVFAGPICVTVVGTRFSVRHTPGMPANMGVHVAVEEGKVRVMRMAGDAEKAAASSDVGDAINLSAGQQVSSDAAGVLSAVSAVSNAGIALWRDNRVSFDNLRLDRAFAEMSRYVDLPLVIRDPAVAALPITGVFDPRDTATLRRVLPVSLPVRLKETGSGVTEVVLAR